MNETMDQQSTDRDMAAIHAVAELRVALSDWATWKTDRERIEDARTIVERARVALGLPGHVDWGTSHTSTHTPRDLAALLDAGVDPATTQEREHSVPCHTCRSATFNISGHCDDHYVVPGAVARAA